MKISSFTSIDQFERFSFHNRSMISPDKKVSCFYCRTSYLGKYITKWTDEGRTAICPCGLDTVLPFEVTEEVLNEAYNKLFLSEDDETIQEYKNKLKNDAKNIPGVNFIEGD